MCFLSFFPPLNEVHEVHLSSTFEFVKVSSQFPIPQTGNDPVSSHLDCLGLSCPDRLGSLQLNQKVSPAVHGRPLVPPTTARGQNEPPVPGKALLSPNLSSWLTSRNPEAPAQSNKRLTPPLPQHRPWAFSSKNPTLASPTAGIHPHSAHCKRGIKYRHLDQIFRSLQSLFLVHF